MSNPVFGIATNEDYAIKFGKLLESEDFEVRLREEIQALKDPDALSSHGWLWLFDWAKSTSADLDQELLLRLFHEWASPFVRAEIVQLATRGFRGETGVNVGRNVSNFPNSFLARIMIEVTRPIEDNNPEQERSWGTRAQSVLVAFLQAGSPIALDAASALLRHRWEGQGELLNFFWVLHESLDPETQGAWLDRLNPPRGSDSEF
jgi:hypothetical protein